MTQFKPGDKVRRIKKPTETYEVVRAYVTNGYQNFVGKRLDMPGASAQWSHLFELVPEKVKLDRRKWSDDVKFFMETNRDSMTVSRTALAGATAMWVLTELAREGCLAWFGNSAKPTVTVELKASTVKMFAGTEDDGGFTDSFGDVIHACRKALDA